MHLASVPMLARLHLVVAGEAVRDGRSPVLLRELLNQNRREGGASAISRKAWKAWTTNPIEGAAESGRVGTNGIFQ